MSHRNSAALGEAIEVKSFPSLLLVRKRILANSPNIEANDSFTTSNKTTLMNPSDAISLFTKLSFNRMPAAGLKSFHEALTEQQVDVEALRSDSYKVADEIMESGQEASTGKNWAMKLIELLPSA